MTPAQIDKLIAVAVEYGTMGIVFVFLLFAFYLYLRYGKSGNGNGKALDVTNTRVDAIGERVSEHTKSIGALEQMAEQNKKEHGELKEMIVKVAERVGKVEDKMDEILALLKPKKKEEKK